MSIIHMDTELARDTARKMAQLVSDMHDLVNVLKARLHKLPWEGPSRDAFIADFDKATNNLVLKTEAGLVLSQRLERESNEWEEAGSSLHGSSYKERMDAIQRSNITRQELNKAEEELRRAKAEFEAATQKLYENEGIQDMQNIQDMLKNAGITHPLLLDYWSLRLYILKRLTDATGLPALINAIKKLSEGESLTVIDKADVLVLGADLGKDLGKGGPLGIIGNIWESIKESARIGDAGGNYFVFNEKYKAYMEAIEGYKNASEAHEASWNQIIETYSNK